jgi:hypothetical protein
MANLYTVLRLAPEPVKPSSRLRNHHPHTYWHERTGPTTRMLRVHFDPPGPHKSMPRTLSRVPVFFGPSRQFTPSFGFSRPIQFHTSVIPLTRTFTRRYRNCLLIADPNKSINHLNIIVQAESNCAGIILTAMVIHLLERKRALVVCGESSYQIAYMAMIIPVTVLDLR